MKKLSVLVLGFWFAIHCPALAVAETSPTIAEIQLEGQSPLSKKRLLRLLPLQKGDPFDADKLERGLQNLRKLEVFEGIEAQTERRPEGLFIRIKLVEAKIISSINLNGHYPYIEAKVRKRLDLQVGEIWEAPRIEEQKKRVVRFFERKGFYNTTVEVRTKPTDRKRHIQVIFDIKKGERLRVGQVLYFGNKHIPTGGLYSFIKPMDIYSEPRIKTALRELIQFYRHRGFLKVKASLVDARTDPKKNRVFLTVRIVEGPKVRVVFKGRRPYRLKTLKETITLFREGNFDSIELRESRKALRHRLKQDGFPEPKVKTEKKRINPDLTHISFNIRPGKRVFVKKIDFEGSQGIKPRKLKKNLLTQQHSITQKGVLDKETLEEDRKLAKEVYLSEGYLEAEVGEPKVTRTPSGMRYEISYPVTEGPLFKVRRIILEGIEETFRKEILKSFDNKEGKPFNSTLLLGEKERVELYYKNHGYPYVTVEQSVFKSAETHEIDITYNVTSSRFVTFGEILLIGDVLTSARSMKEVLGIQSGSPYSEEKILQAELNLRRMGAFTAVKVETIGLSEQAKIVHLTVKVEERPPFVLDLQTRFSTDQQYTGTLLFTNFNSFGWAKQTRLSLTGGVEKNRAELSWLDPRFNGSDVQMSLASWIDYEQRTIDTTVKTGGAIGFFRQFHRFGTLTRYQLTRTYVLEGLSADPRSQRDNTLSEVGLSGSYDRRDSFSDPTKGFFSLIGFRLFNEIQGARADFLKIKVVHTHYWSPFQKLSFASILRIDRIENLVKAASIPQQELFGLGGDDTLRGFREDRAGPLNAGGNPIGGRTRFIFNQELSYRLATALQMALFYDGGSLTEGWNDVAFDTYRHSYGFGLRYITPVGPIRADYGIIIDRQPSENFGRFHLTFGYLF